MHLTERERLHKKSEEKQTGTMLDFFLLLSDLLLLSELLPIIELKLTV